MRNVGRILAARNDGAISRRHRLIRPRATQRYAGPRGWAFRLGRMSGSYITQLLLQQGHRVQFITGHPSRGNPRGDRVPLDTFNFDQPEELVKTLQDTNTLWIRVDHCGRTHQQCIEQTRVMFQAAREGESPTHHPHQHHHSRYS